MLKPSAQPEAPAPASPPRRQRARAGGRWWRWSTHADTRAVQIGVVATLLVHGLILLFAPQIEQLISPDSAEVVAEDWASKEFQIELAPVVVPVPAPPEPPRVQLPQFVEANPNSPDNAPDKTDLVAAQNQQVAQLLPTPKGQSDAPASKGDPSTDSTVLVEGHHSESRPANVQPPTPPPPKSQPSPAATTLQPAELAPSAAVETAAQEAARRAQSPLPGSEKFQGDSPSGYGTQVASAAPAASATVTERVEGTVDAKTDTGARTGLYYKVDAKRPQARPTLAPSIARGRASPLANRALGTENIGAVAYNAKWSNYGEYIQKLIETVQSQWDRILDQSRVSPPSGTKVTVVFRLDAKGAVPEIVKVSGGGGRSAQDACVSAIVARAPYGAWPADMIGVLGESQEITFSFFYK
ncbi:MAG: hypothetical protein H2172_07115 [Opitutus sp.]|nr:hypothetical protein [Opitutus sp.]MCS6247407.1 hypothetical protein [Opitutus sp.]MCS6274096.1 hypothetical protein [Opitutus sp.]MCS6278450.1 hypothetical protein [Opitutus sp.]MCS6300147.1 hypothetical protein [Opitutus sp.]